MSKDSKTIVVVVSGVVLAFVLAIAGGGLLMHGHGSTWLTYRQATAQERQDRDPTVFATVVGKGKPGVDLAAMLATSPGMVAQGKRLFGDNCVACHGAAGKGDGPAASGFHPRPRNFSSPQGWTRGYTLAEIYTTLSEGVQGTGMPSFDTMTPRDRFALAQYVQSLGKFDHKDEPAQEIKQLDAKYHLAAGTHAPNKVAVPTIMKHMAEEYVPAPAVRMPDASDTSAGAVLCRALVDDPVRAAEVLSQSPGWRSRVDVLAQVVVAGAPQNGFRVAAATLSREQWQAFHDELVARTPAPQECRSCPSGVSPSDRVLAATSQ